jgi:hypothetical protein
MPGPDLPPTAAPMTAEALLTGGTQKVELVHGVLIFTGRFDERDLDTAQRTHSGRRDVLNTDSGPEVHPAGPEAPHPALPDSTPAMAGKTLLPRGLSAPRRGPQCSRRPRWRRLGGSAERGPLPSGRAHRPARSRSQGTRGSRP